MTRIAYFTAGTVGAGHLVRGIAVGRGLARAGFGGEYRMFGPALPFPLAARSDYETVEIRGDATLRDPLRAGDSELAERLRRYRPDLLLVDLFWAPLRWILPDLPSAAWLLVRRCPAAWFRGPRSAPFDDTLFERILAIEPIGGEICDETIEPIVVANPDEAMAPDALRRRWGVQPDERLAVVLHAGKPGELAELLPAGSQVAVRRLDLFADDALFPAAEWLGGADLIASGAGYNAFWEARWLGYAERTRFHPFRRRIDDQGWRLERCGDYLPGANGADQLAERLLAR